MPFTKETASKYGKKAVAAKRKHKEDLWAFIASGGMHRYRELLDEQYNGAEISKPQREAMDRTEKLFPYIKARKTDITSGDEKLPTPILAVMEEKKD